MPLAAAIPFGTVQPASAEEVAAAVLAAAQATPITASIPQVEERLAEVWARLGLDISKPITQGNEQISFGDIVLALSLDAGGNGTVQRQ